MHEEPRELHALHASPPPPPASVFFGLLGYPKRPSLPPRKKTGVGFPFLVLSSPRCLFFNQRGCRPLTKTKMAKGYCRGHWDPPGIQQKADGGLPPDGGLLALWLRSQGSKLRGETATQNSPVYTRAFSNSSSMVSVPFCGYQVDLNSGGLGGREIWGGAHISA